jgi:hypothetical protein
LKVIPVKAIRDLWVASTQDKKLMEAVKPTLVEVA